MNFTRLFKFAFGTLIITLAVTLILLSNFGSGSIDAFNSNSSKLINLSVGTCMIITNIIMFIINIFMDKKIIHVISVTLAMFLGILVDMWFLVIPDTSNIVLMSTYFVIALVLFPIGLAYSIRSEYPINPYDMMVVIVVKKTGKSISFIKTIFEFAFMVLAIIVGLFAGIGLGAIAVGTVVVALYIGPALQFTLKYIK